MKKIFTMLLAFVLVMGCYAAPKTEKVNEFVNGVSAVHNDVKDVVSTIHSDTKDVISTIHSDTKDVISTFYGDSKDLVKDLYPEVKSAVIEISKAIGVAAEHLYSVLVKKYVVEGLVQTIPFIVGLALLIIGWIKLEKYVKTNDKIDWRILYPSMLAVAAIVFLCSVDYNTMFMGLVNPEYGAINYILEFTKEMVK